MKQLLTPRRIIVVITGLLLAAYSVYNLYVLVVDSRLLSAQEKFICILVALLFGVLAGFALTIEADVKDMLFILIRSASFVIALLAMFALKLRMIGRVNDYIDPYRPETILYGGAYYVTIAAVLVLLIYYVVVLNRIEMYPKASVRLPVTAILLLIFGLLFETILFFDYGVGLEETQLRTIVTRPLFYLSLVGLSAYFMFPPQLAE